MTQTATEVRNQTLHPIAPRLAQRWSPRGFDEAAEIDRDELLSIIEAARWAPSAGNTQPWSFIVARRGTGQFDAIIGALAGFNTSWTPAASALIVFNSVPERAGKMTRWIDYDLGQAAAHATMQAEYLGYNVHQMGGFDPEAIANAFDLPPGVTPTSVMAIGVHDASEAVAADIRARDAAERSRLPLDEVLASTI
ncbi:MAG: nitroreductase family protein [Brooklawnia sp.]